MTADVPANPNPPPAQGQTVAEPADAKRPPGPERALPEPTSSGRMPFEYAPTGAKGETAFYIWGDLSKTNKTPLMVCHGGPGLNYESVHPLALIHTDYDIPVIMYDQIGGGASTLFPEKRGAEDFWTLDMFMAELDALIQHLSLKRFNLVGHSWGGYLISFYAIRKQPAGLQKLSICNSPVNMGDMNYQTSVAWRRARDTWPEDIRIAIDQCAATGDATGEETQKALGWLYAQHSCRAQPFPPGLAAAMEDAKKDDTALATLRGTDLFGINGGFLRFPVLDGELGQITSETCPGGMLVTFSKYDLTGAGAEGAYTDQPKCRTQKVHFELSGHLLMWEETEAYIKALGEFMRED